MICPICKGTAEQGRDRDYGERLQIRCPRCGPFIITRTALTMIRGRLEDNPRAIARASHAIRARTTDDEWLEIDSTQVDNLVSQPLPSYERQFENFVNWMKQRTGEAQLASVELPSPDALAAIVGAADVGSLHSLLHWASSEGMIQLEDEGRVSRLTPKAWEVGMEEPQARTATPAQETPKIEEGHCPKCGPDRQADVVAAHEERWDDDELAVWTIDDYMILRCRGCKAVYVKHSHQFSENVDYEKDPHTGEFHMVIDPKISYWPAPARRERPSWLDDINDRALSDLLEEVYTALDHDQPVLAAIGARTALDRAMVLKGADEADNFVQKLDTLEANGDISQREKSILSILTDAGGAAAHRAWRPKPEELDTILDGTEAFLYHAFSLGSAVQKIKANVPPKPKRTRKKRGSK